MYGLLTAEKKNSLNTSSSQNKNKKKNSGASRSFTFQRVFASPPLITRGGSCETTTKAMTAWYVDEVENGVIIEGFVAAAIPEN